MITAEQYFREAKDYYNIPSDFYEWEIVDMIEGFGNLMYNQALEDAVKSADLRELCADDGSWYTDKQSILKLKK